METEEVSVRMPDRLLERVDEACEAADYDSRSELVRIALAWSAEGND